MKVPHHFTNDSQGPEMGESGDLDFHIELGFLTPKTQLGSPLPRSPCSTLNLTAAACSQTEWDDDFLAIWVETVFPLNPQAPQALTPFLLRSLPKSQHPALFRANKYRHKP